MVPSPTLEFMQKQMKVNLPSVALRYPHLNLDLSLTYWDLVNNPDKYRLVPGGIVAWERIEE